jgi:hypothetical protein
MFKKIFQNKKFISLLLVTVLVFLFFPYITKSWSFDSVVLGFIGWVAQLLIKFVGLFIALVIKVFLIFAGYSDFFAHPGVNIGWTLARDICNMFFVVILLVIAFCTVLGIEKYSYKRLLGTLVLSIILVNFSKLICGIFIDFSQVIMLTFVNAFKEIGPGNFPELLGLRSLVSLYKLKGSNISFMDGIVSILLAVVTAFVALVVLICLTIVIAARIIAIWFLIVLSPFAFTLGIIPKTTQYASRWWQKFINQVIVGPAVAFFVWLSLVTVQMGTQQEVVEQLFLRREVGVSGTQTVFAQGNWVEEAIINVSREELGELGPALTQIGQPRFFVTYLIGIGFLVASLIVTKELGVAGSQAAVRGLEKLKKWQAGVTSLPFRLTKGVFKGGVERLEAGTGLPIQPWRWKEAYKARVERVRKEREKKLLEKAYKWGIPTPALFFRDYYHLLRGPKLLFKKAAFRVRAYKDRVVEDQNRIKEINAILSQHKDPEKIKNLEKMRNEKENEKTSLVDKREKLERELEDLEKKPLVIGSEEYARYTEKRKEKEALDKKIEDLKTVIEDLDKQINDEKNKSDLDPKERDKLIKEKKEREKSIQRHRTLIEELRPSIMEYEDRIKIQRVVAEEMRKIEDIDEWSELALLYEKAREQKNSIQMEAILKKLLKQGDLNEYLIKRGFTVGWDGLQQLIDEDFVGKLKMDKKDAYRVGNEISLMGKELGQFQYSYAYMTEEDPSTGKLILRKATADEHNNIAFIEARKIEKETFLRKFARWAIFREQFDEEMGKCIPLWDDYVKNIMKDFFSAILAEFSRARLPSIYIKYFAYPKILSEIENLIKTGEIKLDKKETEIWKTMKEVLEKTQKEEWAKPQI